MYEITCTRLHSLRLSEPNDSLLNMMVGFAKRNTPTNNATFLIDGSWMLRISEGEAIHCWIDGTVSLFNPLKTVHNGSRVIVRFNTLNKRLSFELDGTLVNMVAIGDAVGANDIVAAEDLYSRTH